MFRDKFCRSFHSQWCKTKHFWSCHGTIFGPFFNMDDPIFKSTFVVFFSSCCLSVAVCVWKLANGVFSFAASQATSLPGSSFKQKWNSPWHSWVNGTLDLYKLLPGSNLQQPVQAMPHQTGAASSLRMNINDYFYFLVYFYAHSTSTFIGITFIARHLHTSKLLLNKQQYMVITFSWWIIRHIVAIFKWNGPKKARLR